MRKVGALILSIGVLSLLLLTTVWGQGRKEPQEGGRQFLTRNWEGNGPGILHFGQEQDVAGDSCLGGSERQVDQASAEADDHQGQQAHPFDCESFIFGY